MLILLYNQYMVGKGHFIVNRNAGALHGSAPDGGDILAFHRNLPGYRETPLVSSISLAANLGVEKVWVKDESDRFGLPSFKVLGASWAVCREFEDRYDIARGDWSDLDRIARLIPKSDSLILVTATDGNHGRGVARVARWCGLKARIYMPEGTVEARIDAIESEGAQVIVVDGDYDRAVEAAAGDNDSGALLVQDSGWSGYEVIPSRIVEGYVTIFSEIDEQLGGLGESRPDLVAVQIGVGSLAAAAARYYRTGKAEPRLIGVEPESAACAFESIRAGKIVTVPGPHRSVMAGLNCPTVSQAAWPFLESGFDAFVTIDDSRSFEAMRILAGDGITSGESGAAGAAGLLEIACRKEGNLLHSELGLDRSSSILVVSTEGITDPDMYRAAMDGE
jgi:diaminopropionate ammonia-lyase